jgi:putative hemolysin
MYENCFEITIIFLLIVFNGLFAMSEIAIVSARKARLEKWAKDGNQKAAAALALANQPNSLLATIQIGISLTAILTGVFGGATVAESLSHVLDNIPPLKPYSKALAMGSVVITITFVSLILGELVPKRIALINAERIACIVSGPMTWLLKLAAPIAKLLSYSTEFVLTLMGARLSEEPIVTSDEIKLIIDQGAQAGVFGASEHDLVKSVLKLGEKNITALMTPRTDIVWVDSHDTPDEVLPKLINCAPTRVIVADSDLDNITGYVNVKHVLSQPALSQAVDLNRCMEKPLFVPETKSALEVLDQFKKSGIHIAVVLDEFGGTIGVTTMTDLLKAIVGELPVAGSKADLRAVERTDGTWLLDGRLAVDQFKEIVKVNKLPDEERAHFQTLGGFVMHLIGRAPEVADEFVWNGYLFRVVSMQGKRIGKVGVAKVSAEVATGP